MKERKIIENCCRICLYTVWGLGNEEVNKRHYLFRDGQGFIFLSLTDNQSDFWDERFRAAGRWNGDAQLLARCRVFGATSAII